jgi:hypothetical protein
VRDPRFDWDAARRYQLKVDAQAAKQLESFGDLGSLERAIAAWWSERDLINSDDEVGHRSVERLRRACEGLDVRLSPLVTAVLNTVGNSPVEGEVDPSGILARGLGYSVATSEPDALAYDAAVLFLDDMWQAEEEFHATLAATIASEKKGVWTKALGVFPLEVSQLTDPRFGQRPLSTDEITEMERVARSHGPITYLSYRDDGAFTMKAEWWSRARALLRLDPSAFAEVIDALPTKELRRWITYGDALVSDRDLILAVLRAAPPVFVDGRWTGNVAAFLALETYIRHIELLVDEYRRAMEGPPGEHQVAAVESLATFEGEEIPTWLASLVETAFARPDGADLILAFAVHLFRSESRSGVGSRRWPVFLRLGQVLAARHGKVVTATRMNDLFELVEGPALSHLVIGAMLGDDAQGIWKWYVQLLLLRDDGVTAMPRSAADGYAYECIGGTLGDLPNVVETWLDAWRRLFDADRERARFDPNDIDAMAASQHLIRVGIGYLTQRAQGGRPPGDVEARLWREIRSACSHLAQDSDRPHRVPDGFAAEIFLAARAAFGSDWPTALSESSDWLAADPENRVFVAAALLRSGLESKLVFAEMEGHACDPVAALGAVHHRIRYSQELEMACRRVKAAMPASGLETT